MTAHIIGHAVYAALGLLAGFFIRETWGVLARARAERSCLVVRRGGADLDGRRRR